MWAVLTVLIVLALSLMSQRTWSASAALVGRRPSVQVPAVEATVARTVTPTLRIPKERARPARTVKVTIHRVRTRSPLASSIGKVATVAPTPPFNECPADGQDTSCGILIQVNDGGNAILGDPSQPPLDGVEDTLIGVLNSSSSRVSAIALSADTDLFNFDGDGLCGVSPAPSGCPFGSTGYEGPGVSFSDITPDTTGGVVNFAGGIPPGGTAYFSLEEALPANAIVVGGPSFAEQGNALNESEHSTTCSTPRPVNCATGVLWHQFTDFSIPGRGAGLSFTRTYSSSLAGTKGPLGYGWTDNYNMSLSTDDSGNVNITQE